MAAVLVVLALVLSGGVMRQPPADPIRRAFLQRVGNYVALHRCLEGPLAPEVIRPRELQYRFVGTDLILWDVHAGLIVDLVPRALPETTVP